jgi:hypothetical protein
MGRWYLPQVTADASKNTVTTPTSSFGLEEVDRPPRPLAVNSSGVRRLIQALLRTCVSFPVPDSERTWHDEARFASPAELSTCLC